ncbi:MAG: thiamine pyrophosphate-requiring protein [Dehalococcoidia bacterium]
MTTTPNKVTDGRSLISVPVEDGAEAFVEMLNSNGVDYLFVNTGTDVFPIMEALARMMEQERTTPKIVLCIDESTAMFAAHGYYQLTGKAQAVLVHVDAGTINIGGAYHDAQRDRAAIIVCAGRAPETFGNVAPGGRDMNIHWIQEQRDQAGIVRTFTKWDYEVRKNESLNWVVQKAFQTATAEPSGPVYITLPREQLLERMEELQVPPVGRHGKPVSPAADPESLATLADWLVTAERPLIIVGSSGRYPGTVAPLVELAEAVGAPVSGAIGTRMNFPTHHPLNAATTGGPSVKEADVVLVIDHDNPWIPDQETLEPSARVAWIDIDPTKDTIPLWTYPADLLIHASSLKAIPALRDAVRQRLTAADKTRIAKRTEGYAAASAKERKRLKARALAVKDDKPIHPLWIAYCLEQVLEQDAIVMNEGMSGGWPWIAMTDRTQPGTVFTSGGSSLGWGLGAAIGAKLASPDKDVIALEGDGSFVFARPTSAFWAAEKYHAPFLTIIYNNSRHQATVNSWNKHIPDNVARAKNNYVGTDIDPSPDYAVLVQATRGYGETVEDPADVLPAIKRGLERIRAGQAAVIDIRIAQMDGRQATS